ncbi:MAG: MGMT family protein [bacterium]|nr:MGMT family protein [bacterium]
MTFRDKVYKVVEKIPKGSVMTYKEVATAAGNPKAARAVGYFMKTNPFAPHVPCHRVIRSDGKIGGYSGVGGIEGKRKMLEDEGTKLT